MGSALRCDDDGDETALEYTVDDFEKVIEWLMKSVFVASGETLATMRKALRCALASENCAETKSDLYKTCTPEFVEQ